MAFYKEQRAELEDELAAVHRRYTAEIAAVRAEITALELAQVAQHSGLTQGEITGLRETVELLVQTCGAERALFATLTLVDDDPDETAGGYKGPKQNHYSVVIQCQYVEDYGGAGLDYQIMIKTRHDGVRRFVQSMLVPDDSYDTEDDDGELVPPTSWHADWDYHTRIRMRSGV
jgi:hypothetical protein